jgi:hypothetical protein
MILPPNPLSLNGFRINPTPPTHPSTVCDRARPSRSSPSFGVQSCKIMQFQQDFNRKERKEHRDKNLWHFFFAIFAFFAVNSSLVAACRVLEKRRRLKQHN